MGRLHYHLQIQNTRRSKNQNGASLPERLTIQTRIGKKILLNFEL